MGITGTTQKLLDDVYKAMGRSPSGASNRTGQP